MSGSLGSIKRDGSRGGEEPRRQLRRTVRRTKQRGGGASGSTTVVPKPKGDGKVEQKSLTVWDTLLIKASSPEADNMQKQTQNYIWAWSSLSSRGGNAVGTRPAQGIAICWARLEPLSPTNMRRGAILQAGQNVESIHQENHAEHRVSGETVPRSRSTRSNRGRAQVRTVSAHSHGTRAPVLSGGSSEDVKIKVKAFLAEKGVQAKSKAWHNAMQSEHGQRMATAYFLAKRT